MITNDNSFAVNIITATITLFATFPALSSVFSALKISRNQYGKSSTSKNLYEDKDGVATPESEIEFSQKWSKVSITLLTAAAFALNVAIAVLSTSEYEGQKGIGLAKLWLGLVIWVSNYYHWEPNF